MNNAVRQGRRRRFVLGAAIGVVSMAITRAASAWHPCCFGTIGIVSLRAENLPLWVALFEGLFRTGRAELTIAEFRNTRELLDEVQQRRVDIAYAAHMGTAVEQVVKKRDLVVIGSVVNHPTYYAVTKSAQRSWTELLGKRVGVLKTDVIGRYVTVCANVR